MPELPEVETMVRGLRPRMEGATIRRVTVLDALVVEQPSPAELSQRLRGRRIERVGRRGKWVVLDLDDAATLVIQPRMSGGFWLERPDRPEHIRVHLKLDGPQREIWYCDIRRFGKFSLLADADATRAFFKRSHGPDALEITRAEFAAALKRTSRPIKPAIMDQMVLAGVGNIYADESLFAAAIHPERPANGLKPVEITRLFQAIQRILRRAIELEGSTLRDYRTILGLAGGFQNEHRAYGRGGEPCSRCGETIRKTGITGLLNRPTHYCPRCQRLP